MVLLMKKVAIFYICTGKYNVLWKEFYESSEKFFLPEYHKEYFVFTDADSLEHEEQNKAIHRIKQEKLPWPYPTLYRFKMFNTQYERVKDFDYAFFFNANAKFIKTISADSILPTNDENGLVVVKHPRYRACENFDFPYDRNFKCQAYIKYGKGKVYVQGCIIGGTAEAFFTMSKKLETQIDEDLSKNIIARWHDESYLNRYVLKKRYKLLPIQFANNVETVFEDTMIWMRPKHLFFDVEKVKADSDCTELGKFNKLINKIRYNILRNKAIFRHDKKELKVQKGTKYAFLWGLKNYLKIYFNWKEDDNQTVD